MHRVAIFTPVVLALLLLVPDRACGDGGDALPLDAAELVRNVYADEQWIHEVDSFYVRFEGEMTRSPESIARDRDRLTRQFPELEITPEAFDELRPRCTFVREVAFDSERARFLTHQHDVRLSVRIWDGKRALVYGHEFTNDQEYYALDKNLNRRFQMYRPGPSWPEAGPHVFWWYGLDEERTVWLAERRGEPEDFVWIGEEEYEGIICHVVEYYGGWPRQGPVRRLYIGVEDGRLRGTVEMQFAPDSKVMPIAIDVARDHGSDHPFDEPFSFSNWVKNLPYEQRRKVEDQFWLRVRSQLVSIAEYQLSEYQEVAPGKWFPMRQGHRQYHQPAPGERYATIARQYQYRATDVRLNERLADELFAMELKDGVRVHDWGHDPPLHYTYRKDMTDEEWNEIVNNTRLEEARSREAKERLDALIGQAAPPFPTESRWLNSDESMSWEELRGKVVILSFWAEWCGPCRNDLPSMVRFHNERDNSGIIVIGVHTSGSELEKIEKVMKDFDMQYPIVIDIPSDEGGHPWGRLYHAYRIFGIPHAFAIDQQGKIAGHGSLGEVRAIASQLVQ